MKCYLAVIVVLRVLCAMNNQCVLVVLLFLTFSLSIRVVLPVPDRSKCGCKFVATLAS